MLRPLRACKSVLEDFTEEVTIWIPRERRQQCFTQGRPVQGHEVVTEVCRVDGMGFGGGTLGAFF